METIRYLIGRYPQALFSKSGPSEMKPVDLAKKIDGSVNNNKDMIVKLLGDEERFHKLHYSLNEKLINTYKMCINRMKRSGVLEKHKLIRMNVVSRAEYCTTLIDVFVASGNKNIGYKILSFLGVSLIERREMCRKLMIPGDRLSSSKSNDTEVGRQVEAVLN